MGILISIGKWGGIYVVNCWAPRICLGWIAITFFPVDGDDILKLATQNTPLMQALKNKMEENQEEFK